MNKTTISLTMLALLTLSACERKQTEEIELIEFKQTQRPCNENNDCRSIYAEACISGKCTEVDCVNNIDCRNLSPPWDQKICKNNTCISYEWECIAIAMTDYNQINPNCEAKGDSICQCSDYIIDSPRKKIKKGKSVQIIGEQGHFENQIKFQINNHKSIEER